MLDDSAHIVEQPTHCPLEIQEDARTSASRVWTEELKDSVGAASCFLATHLQLSGVSLPPVPAALILAWVLVSEPDFFRFSPISLEI